MAHGLFVPLEIRQIFFLIAGTRMSQIAFQHARVFGIGRHFRRRDQPLFKVLDIVLLSRRRSLLQTIPRVRHDIPRIDFFPIRTAQDFDHEALEVLWVDRTVLVQIDRFEQSIRSPTSGHVELPELLSDIDNGFGSLNFCTR